MKDLITEARELCEKATQGPLEVEYECDGNGPHEILADDLVIAEVDFAGNAELFARSRTIIPELCDALEKANSKLDYLHEDIGSVRAQLHTATFSTNKGAADMAKFILALLPAPPEKEGE